MGWVPWQRPGFDLGLQLEKCLNDNPGIRGIVLGGHGLFTWGDTSYECYINSLEVIEKASAYIEEKVEANGQVFGGAKVESLEATERTEKAAQLAPVLRGLCSSEKPMIGHFTDDERVLEFINSNDLGKLAPLGTSCPDHFLRTKIQPLVLSLETSADLSDVEEVKKQIEPSFEQYRKEYAEYYETCKHPNSPAMRDPNPVIILYPGVGMFSFAKNKQTARVAAEFYINAINVMRGSEAITEYTALDRQEAFNIEYWLLEEAKLKRQPKEKPLSRKVAFISGGGGGISSAAEATADSPFAALRRSWQLLWTPDMLLLCLTFAYSGLELTFFSGVYGTCVGFTKSLGPLAKSLVGLHGIMVGFGEIVGGGVFGILGQTTNRR